MTSIEWRNKKYMKKRRKNEYRTYNKKEYEIILNGSEIWFHKGVPHREGAPAITSKNGCVWFDNGKILSRGKKPSVCYENLKL